MYFEASIGFFSFEAYMIEPREDCLLRVTRGLTFFSNLEGRNSPQKKYSFFKSIVLH